MAINIDRNQSLLLKKNNSPKITRVLLDYFVLREKFENPEKSLFFRLGMNSNQKKLNEPKVSYEKL